MKSYVGSRLSMVFSRISEQQAVFKLIPVQEHEDTLGRYMLPKNATGKTDKSPEFRNDWESVMIWAGINAIGKSVETVSLSASDLYSKVLWEEEPEIREREAAEKEAAREAEMRRFKLALQQRASAAEQTDKPKPQDVKPAKVEQPLKERWEAQSITLTESQRESALREMQRVGLVSSNVRALNAA